MIELDAQIRAGKDAEREWPITEAACDAVANAIFRKLSEVAITSPDTVLRLHAALQTVGAVKKALMQTIVNGQHAEFAKAADDAAAVHLN